MVPLEVIAGLTSPERSLGYLLFIHLRYGLLCHNWKTHQVSHQPEELVTRIQTMIMRWATQRRNRCQSLRSPSNADLTWNKMASIQKKVIIVLFWGIDHLGLITIYTGLCFHIKIHTGVNCFLSCNVLNLL